MIFAVNCGGQEHIDVHGVRYQADFNRVGTPSDYGKNLNIQRVPLQDAILYQTERYHVDTFSYTIPIPEEGDFVLILKFSEVWFAASSEKVFDVMLNDEHTVVSDLDIYEKVGLGTAHDEIIPFSVRKGKLKVSSETSEFKGDLVVSFVKGDNDNPKINAIVVMKGSPEDVPTLPPLPWNTDDDIEGDDEDDDAEEVTEKKQIKHKSGPKTVDPYASDDSSLIFPILISIAVFIPTLFCLCRL